MAKNADTQTTNDNANSETREIMRRPDVDTDMTLRRDIDAHTNAFVNLKDIEAWFGDKGVDLWDNTTDQIKSLDTVHKDELIGKPLAILQWRFNESQTFTNPDGSPGLFVSAEVAYQVETPEGMRLRTAVINDGSTGICKQLLEITNSRRAAGVANVMEGRGVSRGLRKSTYNLEDGSGQGTTYYLDF